MSGSRSHNAMLIGKGNKPAVIPLVPRTARTTDLVIGERTSGPMLLRTTASRLDRRTAHRWEHSIAKRRSVPVDRREPVREPSIRDAAGDAPA